MITIAVDYTSSTAPVEYVCSQCSASGCKLWRQYQALADNIDLLCVVCAGVDQHKDVSTMDARGVYTSEDGWPIDQIGWLVPAVPTEKGDTFWGYTSVPQPGVDWWWRLPTWPAHHAATPQEQEEV